MDTEQVYDVMSSYVLSLYVVYFLQQEMSHEKKQHILLSIESWSFNDGVLT